MGVKERIMSIRLCEKMAKRPQVAAAMNVEFVQEKEVLKDKNWIIEIKPFLGNLDYLCFIVFVHYKNPENYDFQVNL